jgi:hypothetical protein
MDIDVPYMGGVKNLPAILDKVQKAGVPEAFGLDFLTDLGYTSSNDRAVIKVLKYLGMLDSSGRPQAAYREFVDETQAKKVLAQRLKVAYDDLFLADKEAHSKSAVQLKGWFKTKTGVSDAVAEKMATTFRALAGYADFTGVPAPAAPAKTEEKAKALTDARGGAAASLDIPLGLTYRIEVHLPDTTNVDTFRAIFRALREELLP